MSSHVPSAPERKTAFKGLQRLSPHLRRLVHLALGAALVVSTSACSSLFSEGAATTAAIGGAAVAGAITDNAAVASGISLGVLAAAQAGVRAVEKDFHGDQQDLIASIAGPLALGKVASWDSRHRIEIEPDAKGKVTVSRLISVGELNCKEIVFSVERTKKQVEQSAFYVATICRDAARWKWASAEPATERWGALH